MNLRVLGPANAALTLSYYDANRGFLEPWEPERTPEFYSLAGQRRLLAAEQIDMEAGRRFAWWIFLQGEDRVVGAAKLSHVMRGVFESCFLAYKLDQQLTGHGYMTEALQAAIDFAFGPAGLHRIEANIMPRNAASLAVTRRLGFREEGIASRYLKIGGTWEDHARMALIADEWRSRGSETRLGRPVTLAPDRPSGRMRT